jgi:hypothetical protein
MNNIRTMHFIINSKNGYKIMKKTWNNHKLIRIQIYKDEFIEYHDIYMQWRKLENFD